MTRTHVAKYPASISNPLRHGAIATILGASALFFVGRFAHAAVYTAIDLTPSGATYSEGEGISNGAAVGFTKFGGSGHAVLWNLSSSSYVDLSPATYGPTLAYGIGGSQQVGQGEGLDPNHFHALLWTGTASSVVDIQPPGFTDSIAVATDGKHQVGYGTPSSGTATHALLWSGTRTSYVDLNPVGYLESNAWGVDGNTQVGSAELPVGVDHAIIWSGSANNAVDLAPGGIGFSEALAASNGVQVGYNKNSAALWKASAASYVALNPIGYSKSIAYGTNGSQEVGLAFPIVTPAPPAPTPHAVVWSGSATSYVDLQQFLPSTFTVSQAQVIDADGDIIGWASGSDGVAHAMLWVPDAPEPASLMVAVVGAGCLLTRRNRC